MIAGVVAVTSMTASGDGPEEATDPVVSSYGTLTIDLTDRAGTYTLTDPAGNTIESKVIKTSQPCAAVERELGELIVLTPNPDSPTSTADAVQIRDSALGVNTGNTSCGSSSAAVISGNEQLRIELGPKLLAEGVSAESASLRVTKLRKGDLKWKVDAGPFSDPIVVTAAPIAVAPDDVFTSITVQSTSDRDNQGLSIFDGTTFNLVQLSPDFDVAVNCGQFVQVGDPEGDIATNARYERLDNKAGTNACQPVGVRVQIQPGNDEEPEGRVFWDNASTAVDDPDDTQNVQAYFTIDWAPTDNINDLDRDIDYDADGSAESEKMLWCDGFSGGIPNLPVTENPGGIALEGDEEGVLRAPWCLVEDDRELTPAGFVQTQKLFGSGDPWAR